MNRKLHAIRVGLGSAVWTEFKQSIRSPQDQVFYLFTALAVLVYLLSAPQRPRSRAPTLAFPSLALPSILGGLIAFGVVIGPAYALAMEREDGTLLRSKAVPHGMLGYCHRPARPTTRSALLPMLTVILIPSFLLFDDLMHRRPRRLG